MDSEAERGSVPEEGEEELEELTSDFISTPDPNDPDLDVVSRLYLAFFRHFVRLFERTAKDRKRAQDAVQEAFAALQDYYNIHKNLPDNPKGFLFIAARNWLVNEGVKESRHREVPLLEESPSTLEALVDGRSHAREAIQAMESAELKETAYPVLEKLDETTLKIIELHREGKDWDEIAKRLGISSGKRASNLFQRAVHRVKDALAQKWSDCATTADPEVLRWVKSRKSALQAIDLLPAPYNKVLHLLLVDKLSEKEVAAQLGVSPGEVKRHHERANELFQEMYKMTEDELLDVLWHGK